MSLILDNNELEKRRRTQEQPQTTWVKNLIAENEELKEYLSSAEAENERLTEGYESLMEELEVKSQQVDVLEERVADLENEKNEIEEDVYRADNVWEEVVTNMMAHTSEKVEEHEYMKIEVTKLRKLLNKICLNLKIDETLEDQDFQGGVLAKNEKLDGVLRNVDIEIWRLREERDMLRKDKKELQELVEFLETEEKMTREEKKEDLAIAKKACDQGCYVKHDKVEKKHLAFEEKIKNLIQENKRQYGQIQYWSNCSAQLFNRVKESDRDIIQLQERNECVGKVAKKEFLRRVKLGKKLRTVKNKLKISTSKVETERRLKNVILSRNHELKASVKCLEEDLASCDKSLKAGVLECVEASMVFEQNKDLESDVEMLRNQLRKSEDQVAGLKKKCDEMMGEIEVGKRNKEYIEKLKNQLRKREVEVVGLKTRCCELRGEIEAGKRNREMLEERLYLLSNEKDHIENQFENDRKRFKDVWAELKRENNKLQNQLADERKCLAKVNAELGEEVQKRGFVEKELNDIAVEKSNIEIERDKIIQQLENEKERITSLEKELADALEQIEEYKKPKLSRFQRLRRRLFRRRS